MEPHDLEEAIEKAREPFERRVGASMAILAALLALVSVFGHLTTTEELLFQQKASDQWAYYQSKSIRRYQSEFARDVLGAVNSGAASKYDANVEKYKKDEEDIQKRAHEFEGESAMKGRQALRLHFGEIFLEIAIVFSSLAILTRRRFFFWIALAGGAVGAVVSATVFLVG